jgi:drug/metabolite transporter (DMT)-like permease
MGRMLLMSILLAALSSLMYGTADFAGGFASRRNSVFSVIIVSQLAGALLAAAAAPLVGPNAPAAIDLLWGFAAGICGAMGIGFLYRGIGRSIVAVVSPVAALVGALVPLVFGLTLGESPSALAWLGTALCLPAVVLLSAEGGAGNRRLLLDSFLYGIFAGLGFAGFFISVSRTGADAGLWPLLSARFASIFAVLVLALLLKKKIKIAPQTLGVVISAGIFDMGANIAFLLASRAGMLILVTTVTSLYPGPTVLLARLVFHQPIGPARFAGLVLAVAGVILISIG